MIAVYDSPAHTRPHKLSARTRPQKLHSSEVYVGVYVPTDQPSSRMLEWRSRECVRLITGELWRRHAHAHAKTRMAEGLSMGNGQREQATLKKSSMIIPYPTTPSVWHTCEPNMTCERQRLANGERKLKECRTKRFTLCA
jgi:hypothetical protein